MSNDTASVIDSIDEVLEGASAAPAMNRALDSDTYSRAWSGLAVPLTPRASDARTVLAEAGLDWEVALFPAYDLVDGQNVPIPDTFSVRRMDNNQPIGRVGKGFVPFQNLAIAQIFQEMVDRGEMLWASGGTMRHGQKAFLTARLAEDVVVDPGGVNDIIQPFVTAFNSHVGNSSLWMVTSPIRPTCGNMERTTIKTADAKWSLRHTRSGPERLSEALESVTRARKYYKGWAEESTLLARTAMSINAFDQFINDFWGITEDSSKHKKTIHGKRAEHLHYLFTRSETTANGRGTAYAARCAVTELLDFWVPTRARSDELTGLAARSARSIEGDFDGHKTRAHKALLELVRR